MEGSLVGECGRPASGIMGSQTQNTGARIDPNGAISVAQTVGLGADGRH